MWFYIFVPFFNIILYLLLAKLKNGKKMYLLIILTSLMLLSSLRSKYMGADYLVYTNIFENIGNIISYYPIERGYLFFNLIVSYFTNSYVIFSLVYNSIIFIILYKFIKSNVDEKYYFWIILIFIINPYLFIQSTFNVIRQTLSICIVLLGISKLNKDNYMSYLIITFIAGQFHTISYIYALLVIFKFIKWDEIKFFIVLIFSIIINLFLSNSKVIYYVANLFGYGQYAKYKPTMFNFPLYVVFIFSIVLIIILNYKKIQIDNKNEKFFLDLYILSLSLLPIFITNDVIYRIYIGLMIISLPGMYIIFRYCNDTLKKNGLLGKVCYIFYYFLLYCLFIKTIIENNNSSYIPFKFFWQSFW